MHRPATKAKPAPTRAGTPVIRRLRLPVWLMAVLLVLVTIVIYWPAMRCDFVNYDDNLYVTSNVHVQNGLTLESIKWAFFKPDVDFGYWHPLTLLSHMVDCQLFGLKPWGHHLTNVLLHALNTLLVFLLLRNLTGTLWRSLLVAALFGLHPMHVESVAWVSERKDVLSACFGLLALLFYIRYAKKVASGGFPHPASDSRPSSPSPSVKSVPFVAGKSVFMRGRRSAHREADLRLQSVATHSALDYGLSLFFFACGLMSKPMLVTFPFVMFLLDYWPLRRLRFSMPPVGRSKFEVRSLKFVFSHSCLIRVKSVAKNPCLWRLVFEKIPFFALAAAASVVTFVVSKHGGTLAAVEKLPLGARSGNALISYCHYLGKMFWPTDLAVFYPHPGHWPIEKVLLAGGLMVGMSVLLFAKRRRYPCLLMGWLWYCGMLVPAIGLVQVGAFAMADRYTYIPSLGVFILAIWGAYELAGRWRFHAIVLSVVGSLTIVLCLAMTRQQLRYWKNNETLFRHALDATENNYVAHNNLGNALLKKGQIDSAMSHYQEAIRLKVGYAEAYNNLGTALDEKGQIDEAISQFQDAIRLKPDYAAPYNNLGNDLVRKGKIDEAISHYQQAIRLKPDDAEARSNLGIALGRKGQTDEAIRQFQEAIRLGPGSSEAHSNLGTVLGRKGRIDEAISQFQEAVRLQPDYALAYNNLGVALGMKGQIDEAIGQFQEALRLKPDYTDARNNLRNALLKKGKSNEVVR